MKKFLTAMLIFFIGLSILVNTPWYAKREEVEYSALKEEFKISSVDINYTKENKNEEQQEEISTEEEKSDIPSDPRTNEEKVWDALIGAGYTPVQAAGVIGNLYQESGINPSAEEKGGPKEGKGIAQWSYGRKQELFQYATVSGKSWTDLDVQISFLLEEMKSTKNFKTNYKKSFENTESVEEAVESFCFGFERPKKSKANLENRKVQAVAAYERNIDR